MPKFKEIDPQPARGKLDESMWDDSNWIAEEKYDGERRIAQFCDRVVRFTGRRSRTTGELVEKTAQLAHLAGLRVEKGHGAWAHTPPLALEGTVLDGELIIHASDYARHGYKPGRGGLSKLVTSIANSSPEEAIRKQQERGWLNYVVFDCLFYRGKDLRGEQLQYRQDKAFDAVALWNNPFAFPATAMDGRFKRKFYEDTIARGGEGVILKHVDHRYGDEKRWVKVKKCDTADVIVIGYKMAKEETKKKSGVISRSRIAGKVGSVEIGQYRDGKLISVGYARGFCDALMEAFTREPKKYIGKVITIEANDREPTGKFRHPRVVDPILPFRKDKDPKSCVFDLNER